MDELEGQRLKPAEDSASLASSTAEPINLEGQLDEGCPDERSEKLLEQLLQMKLS